MKVLVVYGSKRGGTAGLARMIADSLESRGQQAEIAEGASAPGPSGFDAVIVAGSLYAGRWHRHAVAYARRHLLDLRTRPVWLVSSGPLDNSAEHASPKAVAQVSHAAASIGAKGEVTFGGRLERDARGFVARRIARRYAGDWRDRAQVDRWVEGVVQELERGHEAAL